MKITKVSDRQNSIYDIRLGNLWMSLCIIVLITGLMTILELTIFPPIQLLSVIIPLTFVLGLIGMVFLHFFKSAYNIISVITCAYVGLVLSPCFIYSGHVTSNNAPLFVLLSFFCISFLLDIKKYWPFYALAAYVNLWVAVKFCITNDLEPLTHNHLVYFVGFAIVFVSFAIALMAAAIMQERTFNDIRSQIDEGRNKEKASSLAKSRFLANMSNEIRVPMNQIIGLSELALKEEIDDASKSHVDVLKQSAYDLLEIIDDVLAYSKLETKKVLLNQDNFHFEELLKRVLNSISVQVLEKNLKVETFIDHNIPRELYGDVTLIKQVFLRLIFISISLTENGRIMLSVECDRSEDDKSAHFICKIKDTGCGLSIADINAIEGAYSTYDSKQNSNLKGIGLKFNICDEIMKLMGGSLDVQSISGVGLESSFEFNCAIVNPEPMIRVEDSVNKSILVYVSDSRELESWQAIMGGFNFRPDYVNSYYTFEKALQGKKYDYIFLMNSVYVSVSNIIAAFRCEEQTYVVTNPDQAYGDFDKCRILRHPVSCISISKVFNNQWKAEDYISRREDAVYDCSQAKILVVDDNSVNLKVASSIFKLFKIDIDIAKSGSEAIDKATKTTYDIIFMDLIMPELSGEETLKKMRKSNYASLTGVPVVALTATTGSTVRDEILSCGFQEYLAKPIKKQYLMHILLTFLPPSMIKVVDTKPEKKEKSAETETKATAPVKESILDVKKGIAGVGGNESVYLNILNTYYHESGEKLLAIKKAHEEKDIANFTIYVHAIKSASASIGADTVSEMFKALEAAGKAQDIAFIDSHTDKSLEALKDMLTRVKIYLESKKAFME